MNGYSEDLREKIVTAVGCGLPKSQVKSQVARTFGVSLSSVKRYVKTLREESRARRIPSSKA